MGDDAGLGIKGGEGMFVMPTTKIISCWIRLPLFLMGFSTRLASSPYNVFGKRVAAT